jgi:S1-C subfamily serine protease
VIVALGGKTVNGVDDLQRLLADLPVGMRVPIVVLREGRRLERSVVPAEYPSPVRG